MRLTGKYRAVKYSSLFAITCVICHQFGEGSHVMLSPRQGKYFNRKEMGKKMNYLDNLKQFLVRKAQ